MVQAINDQWAVVVALIVLVSLIIVLWGRRSRRTR
jgi:hypothetical protein